MRRECTAAADRSVTDLIGTEPEQLQRETPQEAGFSCVCVLL